MSFQDILTGLVSPDFFCSKTCSLTCLEGLDVELRGGAMCTVIPCLGCNLGAHTSCSGLTCLRLGLSTPKMPPQLLKNMSNRSCALFGTWAHTSSGFQTTSIPTGPNINICRG